MILCFINISCRNEFCAIATFMELRKPQSRKPQVRLFCRLAPEAAAPLKKIRFLRSLSYKARPKKPIS